MKRLSTYFTPTLAAFFLLLLMAVSCKKFDFNYPSTGEAIGAFQLSAPADNSTLALNSATPAATTTFSWTAAAPGQHASPVYTWIAALQSGSITKPLLKVPSDSAGAATHLTLTQKSLDSLLGVAGVGANASASLIWSVWATNGSDTMQAAQINNLSLTRFGDGASPFVLFAPASSTSIQTINPSSTTSFLSFGWQKSVPGNTSHGTSYKVLFVSRQFDGSGNEIAPDFAHPLISWTADGNGADTSLTVSWFQMDSALSKNGITQAQVAQLDWTVVATSGGFSLQSSYINQLYLLREVDLYLVGSFQSPNQWDPPTGIQMIPDMRSGLQNNMFWEYIYFPANTLFKITQGKSWDINFGGDGAGNLVLNGSNNLSVTTAGVYRVSVNIQTLKYDISPGRMGFVGDAVTNVGWTPSAVFPTAQMAFISTNKFIGLYNFSAGGWKMIDNNAWNDGSNSVAETRSYGSSDGTTLQVNGPNMPNITTAGLYRITWDGTALKTLNFQSLPAVVYLIGDATAGGWDNNNAALPSMTYQGNGVWKITNVPLTAGGSFKFLLQKGSWNFNYGGTDPNTNPFAGGGIVEGGGNIQVAVSGNYTVTLDEYKRTYTVQ